MKGIQSNYQECALLAHLGFMDWGIRYQYLKKELLYCPKKKSNFIPLALAITVHNISGELRVVVIAITVHNISGELRVVAQLQ